MTGQEELEELLYNLNRMPEQPPWFLVGKNDGMANHWTEVARQVFLFLNLKEAI